MARTAAGTRTTAGTRTAAGYRASLLARNALQLSQVAGYTLRFWFRSNDITGVSDGAQFGQWDDSSGNGKHGTQATGSKWPIYHSTEGTYVSWSAAALSFMQPPSGFSSTAAWTAFMVVRAADVGGGAVRYPCAGPGSSSAMCLGGTLFGTRAGYNSAQSGDTTEPLALQIVVVNTWYVVIVRHTGGIYHTTVNGIGFTDRTKTARSWATFTMGGRGDGDQNWTGDMKEFGLIAADITDTEHDELVRQLMYYHNITPVGVVARSAA